MALKYRTFLGNVRLKFQNFTYWLHNVTFSVDTLTFIQHFHENYFR